MARNPHSVPFVRDTQGRITQITDTLGNNYVYTYDDAGNLWKVAYPGVATPAAYTYGLPYEVCAKYKLRRYGFHGTSHRYVALRFAQIHGRSPEDFKLITCHLGNGCSMCAIDRGRSVDTSMGLTPLEGLLMGTRSGDLDPGIVEFLIQTEGLTPSDVGCTSKPNATYLADSAL